MSWTDGYGLIEGEAGEIVNNLSELEWLTQIIGEMVDVPLTGD